MRRLNYAEARDVMSRRANAAGGVLRQLEIAEKACDTAARELALLANATVEARQATGLSVVYGQDALDHVLAAQSRHGEVLRALGEGHRAFGRLREELRLPEMGFGKDGGDPGDGPQTFAALKIVDPVKS